MNSVYFRYTVLLITAIAGGATAFAIRNKREKYFNLVLSFSGAFLFCLTVLHLLPEIFAAGHSLAVYVLVGFFAQVILEQFTHGVEHGHLHAHKHGLNYLLGVGIGLSVHAFMDGFPLSSAAGTNQQDMLWGIALHKIPEGFALASIFLIAEVKTIRVWLIILFFSLMAPAGLFFSEEISVSNSSWTLPLVAIAIGSLIHVSTTILFESESQKHKVSWTKIAAIAAGVGLSLLTIHFKL